MPDPCNENFSNWVFSKILSNSGFPKIKKTAAKRTGYVPPPTHTIKVFCFAVLSNWNFPQNHSFQTSSNLDFSNLVFPNPGFLNPQFSQIMFCRLGFLKPSVALSDHGFLKSQFPQIWLLCMFILAIAKTGGITMLCPCEAWLRQFAQGTDKPVSGLIQPQQKH